MPLDAGTKLGRYEIIAPIGAGGMGEVYRAQDTRLKREVAVKILPDRLARDLEALARFEREAQAVAALSHPNILAIHDVGKEGDTTYVVMEFLNGDSLRERLRQSSLSPRKSLEIAAAIADGLAAAHDKGIVHRDIKPENLFITSDGHVKILDFGLARSDGNQAEPSRHDSPTMTLDTRPGAVLGTAQYMAPEQVKGQTADARSDIFSLGCVLYEMVSGRRAFGADTPAESMTAVLRDEPPAVTEYCSQGAPELASVITRCLEKQPTERFQSARDLSYSLRSVLQASGRTMSSGSRSAGSPRTVWLIGTVAFLALASLAYVMFTRSAAPKGPFESLAVLPFANESDDPDTEFLSEGYKTRLAILPFKDNSPEPRQWLASGMAEEISRQLGRVNPAKLGVLGPETTSYYARAGNALQALRDDLEVDFVLRGSIQVIGEAVRITATLIRTDELTSMWSAEFKGTEEDPFALQSIVAEKIVADLPFEMTGDERVRLQHRYSAKPEAERAYMRGRYYAPWAGRVAEQSRAVSYFEQAIEIDPDYPLAYCGLVDTKCFLATWGSLPAAKIRNDVVGMVAKALALDDGLAEAHASAGLVATFLEWDWSAAEEAFRRAIRLNANIASNYDSYARLLAIVGRYEEAIEQYEQAIQLNPVSSSHLSGLGVLYAGRGRLKEAEPLLLSAAEFDKLNPEASVWLAYVRQQQGRFDAAATIMEQAVFSVDEPELAMRSFLGIAYAMAGRVDDARVQLAEMQKSKKDVPDHHVWFAEIHAALGEEDEAFRMLDQALAERQAWLPHIRFDPGVIHIRDDPRFAELHRKMGLGHVDLSVRVTGP